MAKFIPILTMIILAMPAMATQAITNGGFETGVLDPWTFDFDWSVSSANPHSGSYCALGVDYHYIHQDFTPIPVGEINLIKVWVRQPEMFHLRYRLSYGVDDFDQPDDFEIESINWVQVDLTAWLRTNGSLEGIRFFSYNGGGPDPNHTYIDDVSVNYSGGTAVESASLGELKAVFR